MRSLNAKNEQEEEANTRIMEKVARNLEKRNVGTKRKGPKQRLTSAENLTIIPSLP